MKDCWKDNILSIHLVWRTEEKKKRAFALLNFSSYDWNALLFYTFKHQDNLSILTKLNFSGISNYVKKKSQFLSVGHINCKCFSFPVSPHLQLNMQL